MLFGFIGDVHGRVLHALAAVLTWQVRAGQGFDAIIQAGDLGAFPDPGRLDPATLHYSQQDASELDFSRLLQATGDLAASLQESRTRLKRPVFFIRGNHEDFAWLSELCAEAGSGVASVDRFDLLRFVKDGTVLDLNGVRVAFLGGVEVGTPDTLLDDRACERLGAEGSGAVDVLVTHDGPYGVAVGFHGQTQGSHRISRLVERIQPTFHVAGHYHHQIGPNMYGRTTYLGLNALLPTPRLPLPRAVQAGSLAVLDTDAGRIEFVTDAWLGEIGSPFSFPEYLGGLSH